MTLYTSHFLIIPKLSGHIIKGAIIDLNVIYSPDQV